MKKTITMMTAIAAGLTLLNATELETGKNSPDFAGFTDTGETIKLSDFRGKYVVLEWLNYGCPFVRKHYRSENMQSLQEQLVGEGVVWLSIVSSAEGRQGYMTAEESREARRAHESHATHVVLDKDGSIGQMYGAVTTPHMFLIGPQGKLLYQGAIDSISSTRVSDLERAENYVLSAFEASREGRKVNPDSTRPYGCSIKY